MTKAVKPESIPDGWDVRKLGELLKLNYGKGLPADNRIEGKYPVYGSNGVVGSHNQCLVKTEGIIVGRKGSAGLVHYSKIPFYPIDTTFYITQEDTSLHLPYLFYLLNYCKLSKIKGDVGVPGLNREMAYLEKVMYPTFFEQRNSAHILSKIQSAIETQEKIIQATTELKKALMQKLFTEGLNGEPQKETEIGLVPKSWEVIKLKEVVNFTTGKLNANQAKSDGKYPFFTCSQETFWIDSYAFDTEAVLLSGNNARAIYSVKYFNGKFNAYQRTYVITIKDTSQFSYTFLKYILAFNLERLRKLSIGTSTKYLTLGILENLEIIKPKIDEQENIANALSTVESKIESSQAKLKSLQSLFRSMLHHLVTGQIRVKDLKVS